MYWVPVNDWPAEGNKLMSIQEVSAERFAQLFHHYHQSLSSESAGAEHQRTTSVRTTSPTTRDAWADLPPSERNKNDRGYASRSSRSGTRR